MSALLRAMLVCALVLGVAPAAVAHPLGNFSINQYSALELGGDGLYLRYLVDMAEIPTFQAIQDAEVVAEVDHPAAVGYVTRMAATLAQGAQVIIDGRRAELEVVERDIIFPPGAGGLPTLKLGVLYRIRTDVAAVGDAITLEFRDDNFPDRAGWKEVIAVARPGVTVLKRDVADVDRSRELAEYPTDLLESPPQLRMARVTFARVAPAAVGPTPPRPLALRPTGRTSTSRVADLIGTPELGVGLVLTALLIAAALGAFHALEPGHGKSIVAAYLVGSRGTARHAVILGLVVTASHTAGVYLLGGVTFYASAYVVPERLYPWLAATSGVMIALVGATLFLRRWGRPLHAHSHGHAHSHDHAHAHAHGGHVHTHEHGDGEHHHHGDGEIHAHAHAPDVGVRLRDLVALGISGGIVPCPAALVVLLTAVSAHKIGFGLLLIVAFSLGLAAVLVAIGVLMVYARRVMARFREDGPLLTRWLPLTSSAVMTVLGVAIAVQALPWTAR